MIRLVAAVVAIIVLLLAGPLAGAAPAAPDARPRPDTVRQPTSDDSGPLRLELDELAPRVVTADGPTVLTVTGVLTNTGAEPVAELGVRLQRGLPLTGEGQVRDALEGAAPTDAIAGQFQEIPDSVASGAQVPVRLTVPLRGDPDTTLALSGTGVYELLVNVNGAPQGGDRARLAAVRLLLPVLGLPAGADGSPPVTSEIAGPEIAAPTPFTLLYPITDEPRRLSTVPGEPVLLTDDTLAGSFAVDGRLGGLVAALAGATAPARTATCVAVDPDLLQTAEAMTAGYQVVGADGGTVPGRGAEAAAVWLDGLRAAVAGGCVLPLPFADADLVALTRGGLADRAVDAVTAGAEITAGLLQTPVLDTTAWPADGVVDEPTLEALVGGGTSSLVLSADGVETSDPSGVVPLGGPSSTPAPTAVLADPLLTLAAGGVLAEDAVVAGAGAAADPTGARGALGTQDALGAVAFRATEDPPGAPLVLAPPHGWDTGGPAAQTLLDGVDRFVTAGLLTPRGLGEVVTAGSPAGTDGVALRYPLAAGIREVPATTVVSIGTMLADIADLRSSVVEDGQGVESDAAFDPLLRGALRPASAAWRGEPGRSAASAADGVRRISAVRGSVAVLEPPSPFSLGSSDSPLLLTVANGLPVTMSVRVELASTSGLRVAPIPAVEIPPLGRRQIQANAEVLRSGVFTVDAAVRTQDGGLLGPPSRLQVRSTAYGTITLWLTGTAGVLLVVLAGRRILRRVRAEPGRYPDERAPEPAPDPTATPDDLRLRTVPSTPRPHPDRPHPDPPHPAGRGPNPGNQNPADPDPTVPVRMSRPPHVRPNGPSRPGPPTGQNPPAPSVPVSAAGPGRPPADRARPPADRRPTPGFPGEARPTGEPHPHPPDLPPGRAPGSR